MGKLLVVQATCSYRPVVREVDTVRTVQEMVSEYHSGCECTHLMLLGVLHKYEFSRILNYFSELIWYAL